MLGRKVCNISVPLQKELANVKKTTYKIKFIDSARFMVSSLSDLAGKFTEVLQNSKCKGCKSCHKYITVEDKIINF